MRQQNIPGRKCIQEKPMKYIYYNDQIHLKQYRLSRSSKVVQVCLRIFALSSLILTGLMILHLDVIFIKFHNITIDVLDKLTIHQVEVFGNKHLSKNDILKCANISYDLTNDKLGETMVCDSWKILENLKSCKQIAKAEVIRILPSRLIIKLQEKQAYAIWRHQNNFFLLDINGDTIRNYVTNEEKAKYIILFGDSANKETVDILPLLENIMGDEYSQVASLHLISQRRWNMLLLNGLLVKLPENNPEMALRLLVSMR